MPLVFVMASIQLSYMGGEPVYVTLSLSNTGTAPIRVPRPDSDQNWQPVFTITGPGPTDQVVADLRRGVHHGPLDSPAAEEADCIDIDPGETWEGALEIDQLVPLEKPGEYRVQAVLEWDGSRVESNAAAFALEPFAAGEISVGLWGNPPGSSVMCLWLQGGKDGQTVFEEQFREERGEDPRMERSGARRRAAVPSGAANPVTQSASHSLLEDVFRWAFWRVGTKLYGLPTVLTEPLALDLPEGVKTVLSPALLDRSHAADVFLVAGPGKAPRLLAAQFTDPMEPGAAAPRIFGEIALPAPDVVIATGHPEEPGHGHIAAAAVEGHAVRFFHLAYTGAALPAQFDARVVEYSEELQAVPDSPPAVFVESDGTLRVSLMVRRVKPDPGYLLMEARFGLEDPGSVTSLSLPPSATGSRIGYFQEGGGTVRREWALWTEEGAVYTAGENGEPRMARDGVLPGGPRNLVVLADRSYLVEVSPVGGVMLNPL